MAQKLPKSFVPDEEPTSFEENKLPSSFIEEKPAVETKSPIEETKSTDSTPTDLGPLTIPFALAKYGLKKIGEKVKKQFEPSTAIPQLAGEEPGVLNPNLEENPLLLKSWLPETTEKPGLVGKLRHGVYENLIRPIASPLGAYSSFLGEKPAEHPSLAETFAESVKPTEVLSKSKPRVRANLDKTFTDLGTGEVLDSLGKPVQTPTQLDPVSKLISALDEAKPLTKEQAKIYTAERGERVARAEEVKTTGLQGHYERLAKLKGEHTKVSTEPLKLEQGDVDTLVDTINNHPNLMRYEKENATTGLVKILGGQVPQESEIKLLERAFGPDVMTQIRAKLPKIDTKRSLVSDLANVPRSIQSSFDLSFPFRQGLGLIHTKPWWTSWGSMVKSYGSENSFRGLIGSILDRPNFRQTLNAEGKLQPSFAQRAGLKLTDLTSLASREESMQSTIAEKIPGIRASNRAYTAFADKLRADNFDNLIKQAEKQGLNPKQDLTLAKEIASYINNASGRGDLGKLERSAVTLNTMLFSPRLIASRLQMMNPRNYVFSNPFVRKQYLKSILAMATTWTTLAGLAKMGGADVSLDPNSADFGKIKIGNTRLDPAGGFQQYLVLLSRLTSGQYTTSTSGKSHQFGAGFGTQTRLDALTNFIQNKLAPIPSYAAGFASANEYRPFEVGDRTIRMFAPILLQDLSDLAQEDPELLPLLAPSAIGMGVQNYGEREPNRLLPESVFPHESDISVPSRFR